MTSPLRRTRVAALALAAVVAAPIIATNAGASPDTPPEPKTSCPTSSSPDPSSIPCDTSTTIWVPPIPTTTTTTEPAGPPSPVPECSGRPASGVAGVPPTSPHFAAINCTMNLGLLSAIYTPGAGAFPLWQPVRRLDVANIVIHIQDILRDRLEVAPAPTTTTTTAPTTTTTVAPPVFPDLPRDLTTEEKFQRLLEAGIFQGTDDGLFDPAGEMTRAQFAAIIARLLGGLGVEPPSPPSTPTFADVPPWAAGYIEAATHHGLFEGYSNGNFSPNGELSSSQLASVTFRLLALKQLQGG